MGSGGALRAPGQPDAPNGEDGLEEELGGDEVLDSRRVPAVPEPGHGQTDFVFGLRGSVLDGHPQRREDIQAVEIVPLPRDVAQLRACGHEDDPHPRPAPQPREPAHRVRLFRSRHRRGAPAEHYDALVFGLFQLAPGTAQKAAGDGWDQGGADDGHHDADRHAGLADGVRDRDQERDHIACDDAIVSDLPLGRQQDDHEHDGYCRHNGGFDAAGKRVHDGHRAAQDDREYEPDAGCFVHSCLLRTWVSSPALSFCSPGVFLKR